MKFKFSALLCAVTVLCLFSLDLKAQTQYFLPQLFPRSPNATALEKYGTYQVNEFTGVPDISIPLYTIEAGDFKIPITLSYHASGIKLSEAASWAGLGWSVSAGGQISRRTFGLPDDSPWGYLNSEMHQLGTYNSNNDAGLMYEDSVASGRADGRPDIFSYDFPGHDGKFFFDGSSGQHFAPRLVPFAPITITHTPTNGLTSFTITDEHGSVYQFGNTGAMETTFTESEGTNPQTMVSAWKMSSMISQNRRDTVSFSYQSDNFGAPTSDSEIYTVTDQVVNLDGTPYSPSFSGAPRTPGNSVTTTEELPRQINFRNGKVVFDTVARTDLGGAYRLKDIKIYQYNYATKVMEVQKTIVFYHSYFAGVPRLRLDSIQVLDKAGSVMQHYSFDYNTTYNMPGYTSFAQDYWGYYNGCDGTPHKTANTMLTPQQRVLYSIGNTSPYYVTIGQANRYPDSNYMQMSVLTGIHYPTGGYSTFTYQTNQYIKAGIDSLAGGLRIHTISSYDGVNPTPIIKTYVYNNSRKNFFLDYAYFVNFQTHRHYSMVRSAIEMDGTEVVRSYSSNPHCDLEAFDAATVVYPSVTEYIGTPGTNIGRTDYTFTDQTDSYLDASAAGSLIYLSSFYIRGHLLTKKEYIHRSDGSYQIVRADTNGYTAFPPRHYSSVGLVIQKVNYNEGDEGNPIPSGFTDHNLSDVDSYNPYYYDIISDDNYLTGTTTNIYDINDPTKYTTSTVAYAYDDTLHQQIVQTTHVDSKGNTHISSTKYAYDYLQGLSTFNTVLDTMIERHMYAEPVEKWDSLKNVATSVNAVTGAQLNQYKFGYITGSIVPSTISTLGIVSPVTNFNHSHVTSGTLTGDFRYVQMISFDQYDNQNNILQYTPRNATPTAILWNYTYELPVAQVKNATTSYGGNSQIAYTSFEADGQGKWFYNPTYAVKNTTAPTGSYVYPLSAGSITSQNLDNTRSYVVSYWSNNGAATLSYGSTYYTGSPLTTVNGWTYYEHQLPATGSGGIVTISGSTSIDELRLYPSASQMTTYAYEPEGLNSIADTKGSISHFEYDYFARLKNIKDFYGNIVNNYSYHTYNQTITNTTQSGTFTRNNCPLNTNPGSLTYTVPANRYYSSTLASANADATYDLDVNGQAKANQNCGCPIVYINITVTNSSGISGFPITFSGLPQYSVPTGTSSISVPQGVYSSVQVGPFGSGTHNFSLGAYPSQNGVHSATFNTVQVGPTFTITIQ